jgi:ABC-type antimicrobial peptide transport system permease subunit
MDIPLLAGRDFSESDAGTAPKVCIVNETLAKRFLGGAQQAVGHFIALGTGNVHPDIQIIGVARNTKYSGVKEDNIGFMYFPYLQDTKQAGMSFYVRSSLPADQAASEIRRSVQSVDAGLPIQFLQTMEQHVTDSLSMERIVTFLSLIFGALAAGLAAMGLYGLLAYSVTQRTREIGIRVALGATRGNVVRLVLQDVILLGGIAIAVALPLSFGIAYYLRSQLYGISAHDPVTYAGVVLVVAATTLVAGALPAFRASHLDPLTALRSE